MEREREREIESPTAFPSSVYMALWRRSLLSSRVGWNHWLIVAQSHGVRAYPSANIFPPAANFTKESFAKIVPIVPRNPWNESDRLASHPIYAGQQPASFLLPFSSRLVVAMYSTVPLYRRVRRSLPSSTNLSLNFSIQRSWETCWDDLIAEIDIWIFFQWLVLSFVIQYLLCSSMCDE